MDANGEEGDKLDKQRDLIRAPFSSETRPLRYELLLSGLHAHQTVSALYARHRVFGEHLGWLTDASPSYMADAP